MAHEMGTGASLKVKHGQGRESTFYGGSVHLTQASQKNLTLARRCQLNKQSDKEYQFEVKQIFQRRWNLKQHLLRLRKEKEKVTYLDGGSRGKPRSQWDTSIEDVRIRHARTMLHIPYSGASKSDESLHFSRPNRASNQTGPFQEFQENSKSRLTTHGLYTVSSDDSLQLGISGKPIGMETRTATRNSTMRLPNIHASQRVSSTRSDFSDVMKRPALRHSNTTLGTFHLAARRRSRSLSDLKDFRQTLKSAV